MNLKFWACVLTLTMAALSAPVSLGAAAQQQQQGTISGTAVNAANQPLAQRTVRLRNMTSGQIVATTQTNAAGQYTFTGIPAGQYIVEVVENDDPAAAVIATSGTVTLAAGQAATGVAVTASAAAAGAAGAAAAGGGAFLTSALGLTILAVAAGVGITTAIVAANDPASPAQ
jgi:hypothetical protein